MQHYFASKVAHGNVNKNKPVKAKNKQNKTNEQKISALGIGYKLRGI